MSRRETFIVAFILNVGVLTLLFISALKSPVSQVSHSLQEESVKESTVVNQGQKTQVPSEEKAVLETASLSKEGRKLLPFKVESGDVIEKIAKEHSVSAEEVMELNELSHPRLKVGQILYLPEQKQESPSPKTGEGYYTVKSGDNPWLIAKKNQIPLETLLDLNHLDQETAKRLKPGDRLRIR